MGLMNMAGARAVDFRGAKDPSRRLYDLIGKFLFEQRLDPDPSNFAFAYHLFSDPDSPLAQAAHQMIDGGVRLTQRDVEKLGSDHKLLSGSGIASAKAQAEGLVARTQMQVEGFQDMVLAMRAETEGFGRDLAASAAAIHGGDGGVAMIGEVARLTTEMLERVHSAEARLERANREANELREKLEEARDNARRDPLTDLPNRRAFEEAYAAQMASGAPLCVAVCDVDHFKSVNDRFGHIVGDRVLKAIAEVLAETCHGHLVARYGGEEFAILFSDLELTEARRILEAARVKVADKHYRLRETDEPLGDVTFSSGVTQAKADEHRGTVFHRADRLLYAAKAAGRNRVLSD